MFFYFALFELLIFCPYVKSVCLGGRCNSCLSVCEKDGHYESQKLRLSRGENEMIGTVVCENHVGPHMKTDGTGTIRVDNVRQLRGWSYQNQWLAQALGEGQEDMDHGDEDTTSDSLTYAALLPCWVFF